MNRLTFAVAFVFGFGAPILGQNLQLHYDFGAQRQMVTATVELFRPDSRGHTFFFFDLDQGARSAGVRGSSLAYFELVRTLRLGKSPWAVHGEWNTGLFRTQSFADGLGNAALVGLEWATRSADGSRNLSLALLYKYIDRKHNASFQLTAVWGWYLWAGRAHLSGFADFWREDNLVFDPQGNASHTHLVFLSEPQLWLRLHPRLWLGGEGEISCNFAAHRGWMLNPTLGLKWLM